MNGFLLLHFQNKPTPVHDFVALPLSLMDRAHHLSSCFFGNSLWCVERVQKKPGHCHVPFDSGTCNMTLLHSSIPSYHSYTSFYPSKEASAVSWSLSSEKPPEVYFETEAAVELCISTEEENSTNVACLWRWEAANSKPCEGVPNMLPGSSSDRDETTEWWWSTTLILHIRKTSTQFDA